MSKIYKPEDFPSKDVKAKRPEIISKVDESIKSGNYTKLDDNTISVTIVGNYDKDELIDFQSSYALIGNWTKVETTRIVVPDSNNEIKIFLHK